MKIYLVEHWRTAGDYPEYVLDVFTNLEVARAFVFEKVNKNCSHCLLEIESKCSCTQVISHGVSLLYQRGNNEEKSNEKIHS